MLALCLPINVHATKAIGLHLTYGRFETVIHGEQKYWYRGYYVLLK